MRTDFAESREEYLAWRDAITRTHQRRIRVRVLDLEHRRLAYIDDPIDGQVTIDVENREVSRIANLTLYDPSRSIGWEPDSPSSLPLHLRRMVQIIDDRRVPGYGWVGCSVFCGPVSEMDRDGATVTIVAEGKDRLALGSFGRSHTWKKGRRVVDVIREIMELAGEKSSRIDLPEISHTLPKDFNVSRMDKPLVQARRLARSVNRVVFYDGRGHFRMRRHPTHTSLRIDKDWLLGPVRLDRPKLEFFNGWIVLGAKPGGDQPRITSGLIGLPKNHPFSAYSLRRNGQWRWLIHQEERTQVQTNARAREIAMRMRDERIRASAEVSLDCLPFPNVEEWDLLKVVDPLTGITKTRVRQATIPLVEGAQTIGAVRRVASVKRHGGYHPPIHQGL